MVAAVSLRVSSAFLTSSSSFLVLSVSLLMGVGLRSFVGDFSFGFGEIFMVG